MRPESDAMDRRPRPPARSDPRKSPGPLYRSPAIPAPRSGVLLGLLRLQPPLAHCVRKHAEDLLAVLPADAAVGDAHAVDELLARKEVLPACLEVALRHDAED